MSIKTLLIPAWRGFRLLEHLLTGAMLSAGVAVLGLVRVPQPWRPTLVSWWHRRLLRCLGLNVLHRGAPAVGALFVANHVSWLDIPVLGGAAPLRFVSKSEVRHWPLVGWMAATAGTLFMQRGAHEAAEMAQCIRQQLQHGASIAIFPEGTTSDGRALRRFHARLFGAAEQDGAAVQPVAIRYGRGLEPDATAPFIGDDTLVAHLWRLLRHPGLTATVCFLPLLDAGDEGRRELADAARAAIAAQLARQARDAVAGRTELQLPEPRAPTALARRA